VSEPGEAARPPDDPSIGDEVMLFHRVPTGDPYLKKQGDGYRPTSAAFQNSTDDQTGELLPEMSIVLATVLGQLSRDPSTILGPGQEDWGIAQFTAGQVRRLQVATLGVVASPTNDEPAHGDVTGWLVKRPVRQAVAKLAEWYQPPRVEA
jgi:hypothetical protein